MLPRDSFKNLSEKIVFKGSTTTSTSTFVRMASLLYNNPLWARLEISSSVNALPEVLNHFPRIHLERSKTKPFQPNNWFINQRIENGLGCCRIHLTLFSFSLSPAFNMHAIRNWVVPRTMHDKTAVISHYESFPFRFVGYDEDVGWKE